MSIRIRYACPHCNRRIVHHPELAGQLVICSACKGEFYEPTDPLPGKPAEEALQPRPEAPRRLRVPEGSNPRHDLALLARRDASDMRTITEIVEAVLLDDGPPLPVPAAPQATGLAGPKVQPLVPTMAPPATVAPKPPASRPIPKPAVPVSSPSKSAPDRPLAEMSVKQMTEELRRRGLGVALITCEMNPMRNFELGFSDNMTRDDALAILRKYLDTLREVKPTEKPGLLKRMWQKGERE